MHACRYFGKYPNTTTLADIKTLFKPYKYGYATEVITPILSPTQQLQCFPNAEYICPIHSCTGGIVLAWWLLRAEVWLNRRHHEVVTQLV